MAFLYKTMKWINFNFNWIKFSAKWAKQSNNWIKLSVNWTKFSVKWINFTEKTCSIKDCFEKKTLMCFLLISEPIITVENVPTK